MIRNIKEQYSKIPVSLRLFVLKAVVFFVSWQLLYHFLLQPYRVPDSFLTDITGIATEKLYALFYNNVGFHSDGYKVLILINGQKVVGIADPCNAFEIYILYIAFLVCYPANVKRRLRYILVGLPILFMFNIVRAAAITWLNIYKKGWVDFSHHYLFTSIMYFIVFLLWLRFTKKANDEMES